MVQLGCRGAPSEQVPTSLLGANLIHSSTGILEYLIWQVLLASSPIVRHALSTRRALFTHTPSCSNSSTAKVRLADVDVRSPSPSAASKIHTNAPVDDRGFFHAIEPTRCQVTPTFPSTAVFQPPSRRSSRGLGGDFSIEAARSATSSSVRSRLCGRVRADVSFHPTLATLSSQFAPPSDSPPPP